MKNKNHVFSFLLIVVLAGSWLQAGEGIYLTLRIYKGVRDAGKSDPDHVNSYALKKIADATILSDTQAFKEKNSIIKIYNLKYAHYLYKVEMQLPGKGQAENRQNIVLSNRQMVILIGNVAGTPDLFRARIISREKHKKPLLESEIIIPEGKTAVLGFEDSDENIFFLAMKRVKDRAAAEGKIIKSVEVPELVSRSIPVYPSSALEKNITGVVVLECHTDLQGQINKIHVIDGPLELAEAVKTDIFKWKYSPWKIDGKPEPIRMNLMIFFKIKDESIESPDTSEKGISEIYARYKPMMKKWKTSYPVSEENKAIVEIIIVEGKK